MKVQGVGWVGIRTDKIDEMVNLFENVLKMPLEERNPGLAVFRLPSGALVDVFGPPAEGGEKMDALSKHFTTGPVPGFWVEDVAEGRRLLEAAGIELLGEMNRWGEYYSQHFRAPDGTVYEIFTDPKFKLPNE